ncbi:ral-GDS-related protein-like [Sorex araneus]|uniref:ral-GDS-related protein-like n=1 Tax=Sorex araneus TaxID=42254 RepID=UPI0024338573|nr:ral-GDS-related protein-like [Sorex araneus]
MESSTQQISEEHIQGFHFSDAQDQTRVTQPANPVQAQPEVGSSSSPCAAEASAGQAIRSPATKPPWAGPPAVCPPAATHCGMWGRSQEGLQPLTACWAPGATSAGDERAVPEGEPAPGPSAEASCSQSAAGQSQPRGTAWDVLAFPPRMMAEQLTWMDLELFKKVVPQQCLGAVWARRREKGRGEHTAPTVQATVTQFNNIVSCVITSCLGVQTMSARDRARRVEHWIQVAKGCHHLRSFSALHAILCALRSSTLQRLHKTWNHVCRNRLRKFQELCRTDYKHSRILFFEETQGWMVSLLKKPYTLERKCKKGAVPFLGKALAELLRLHYMEDYLQGDIVLEQREIRENHILNEIVLLQGDSDAYDLEPVDSFMESFRTMERLSGEESYALSCLLEPRPLPGRRAAADPEPWNTATFFLLDIS